MFTLNPGQNYTHLLVAVSGSDGMHDLQFAAPPHKTAGVVDADFRRGSLVSLQADGTLREGFQGSLVAMGLWAINDVTDYDAASDTGNMSGGVNSAFVATGGYELKTTELDLEYHVVGDYTPGTLLTDASIADAAQAGKVGPVTLSAGKAPLATPVVGVVTKTLIETYNQSCIRFWPVYLPSRV